MHVLPVKIECRWCLGDGYVTYGFSRPYKVSCGMCEGRKHVWISPTQLKDSDVVLKR